MVKAVTGRNDVSSRKGSNDNPVHVGVSIAADIETSSIDTCIMNKNDVDNNDHSTLTPSTTLECYKKDKGPKRLNMTDPKQSIRSNDQERRDGRDDSSDVVDDDIEGGCDRKEEDPNRHVLDPNHYTGQQQQQQQQQQKQKLHYRPYHRRYRRNTLHSSKQQSMDVKIQSVQRLFRQQRCRQQLVTKLSSQNINHSHPNHNRHQTDHHHEQDDQHDRQKQQQQQQKPTFQYDSVVDERKDGSTETASEQQHPQLTEHDNVHKEEVEKVVEQQLKPKNFQRDEVVGEQKEQSTESTSEQHHPILTERQYVQEEENKEGQEQQQLQQQKLQGDKVVDEQREESNESASEKRYPQQIEHDCQEEEEEEGLGKEAEQEEEHELSNVNQPKDRRRNAINKLLENNQPNLHRYNLYQYHEHHKRQQQNREEEMMIKKREKRQMEREDTCDFVNRENRSVISRSHVDGRKIGNRVTSERHVDYEGDTSPFNHTRIVKEVVQSTIITEIHEYVDGVLVKVDDDDREGCRTVTEQDTEGGWLYKKSDCMVLEEQVSRELDQSSTSAGNNELNHVSSSLTVDSDFLLTTNTNDIGFIDANQQCDSNNGQGRTRTNDDSGMFRIFSGFRCRGIDMNPRKPWMMDDDEVEHQPYLSSIDLFFRPFTCSTDNTVPVSDRMG